MWAKLLLLVVYLTALFVLSRILEAIAYYEDGYLASHLLDPVSLSVKKLKILLDQRGVSYAGVVEKQELTELVDASGDVSEGEMETAILSEESSSSTNFSCGTHFYEEVEDTKDSVWVVQVIHDKWRPFLRDDDWLLFMNRVARFGVRTGIFDCSLDYHLCERKGWRSSRLVLALPQGYRAKGNVILKSYLGSAKSQPVLDWVNTNLASRTTKFPDQGQLEQWFSFRGAQDPAKLRVVLFSSMDVPPMFYSVLSVKFSGRVQFGSVNSRTEKGRNLASKVGIVDFPKYLIITPERNYTFGTKGGEYLDYRSLGLFLRTLHPEVNDIFLLSLIVANAMCWFEFAMSYGNLFKRLGNFLWLIGKWNFLLILLWLPLLGLFQFPYMDLVLDNALKILRLFGTTLFASWVRSDWLGYTNCNCSFLCATFLLFVGLVGIFHLFFRGPEGETTNNRHFDFFNFNWDTYISCLFRPMATLTRPMSPHNLDLEVGMELIIERLAVPNLWLQPLVSSQYITDLPVWKYTGPNSEGEEANNEVPMFVCEKCRVLQNNNQKSEEEIEQERMDSERACAKYLMDGDYKCMCEHGATRRSPKKERYKADKKPEQHEDGTNYKFMPNGILANTECAICLESYKSGVLLCGLPCHHSFHHYCIMGWLTRDNHCCPVCRWPAYKAKPCSMHQHAD
ncbi:hypothetical protein CAPTEDRAFT_222551 [Capitella teleta]|uniref:RING-type domain-containing protein n=1 Tax=Capitella teleta TaxID=283909 RepID=R7UUH0_CAPTE|nr:hypothetical protein CAPTEDRAFT_222551 [Capitella teleta]|eukprot:ELU09840.1 hypothetical protein CAPTEDRAFT_222551 [Capitella teleta]